MHVLLTRSTVYPSDTNTRRQPRGMHYCLGLCPLATTDDTHLGLRIKIPCPEDSPQSMSSSSQTTSTSTSTATSTAYLHTWYKTDGECTLITTERTNHRGKPCSVRVRLWSANYTIMHQSTKASHNKRVSNSILVCRGFLVFVFLVGFRCSEDLAVDLDLCKLMGEWCNACDINNSIAPLALPLGLRGITILSGEYPLTLLGSSIIPVDDVQFFLI